MIPSSFMIIPSYVFILKCCLIKSVSAPLACGPLLEFTVWFLIRFLLPLILLMCPVLRPQIKRKESGLSEEDRGCD